MVFQGGYRPLFAIGLALAVAVVMRLIFPIWFKVPLLTGPLEALLGLLLRRRMANLDSLFHGFAVALTVQHVALMMVGVLLGILVGVLPGLGAPNGVTLLLPLTYTMDPVGAIILLTSMYWGALFGGSTTSILFNIPGEPSSVATTFDGHPMAKQGQAVEALSFAFLSAGFGALVGVIVITLLSGGSRASRSSFRPPSTSRSISSPSRASSVCRRSARKTLVSILLGFAFATVGMDTISGSLRLTFGFDELLRGISFLIVVIGLFGIGELLLTMEEGLKFEGVRAKVNLRASSRRSPACRATGSRSCAAA